VINELHKDGKILLLNLLTFFVKDNYFVIRLF